MMLLRKAAQNASDYYPETMGQYFILNAPSFFPFLWGIIKQFLDEKTRNKIKICSASEQLQALSEVIDLDNLPSYLGGNCKCEQFGGDCLLSNKGPWDKYQRVFPRGVKLREEFDFGDCDISDEFEDDRQR